MTVRDHMTLRLAATPYRFPARRESDVLEQLGWTPTRFWARVNALLDRPDVEAAYPREVRRLRRLRDARREARQELRRDEDR